MAITHWDSKGARRDLRRAQAQRRRMILIIGVTVALMLGGVVRVAMADAQPRLVAAFIQKRVNRSLAFSNPGAHVGRVVCIGNGDSFYTCKGRLFAAGSHLDILWQNVRVHSDGRYWIPKPTVLS